MEGEMFQFNVLLNQLRSFYLEESFKRGFLIRCLWPESSLFVIVLFSFKIVKMRKVRMLAWSDPELSELWHRDSHNVLLFLPTAYRSLTTTENVFHPKPARRENNFDSSPSVSTLIFHKTRLTEIVSTLSLSKIYFFSFGKNA